MAEAGRAAGRIGTLCQLLCLILPLQALAQSPGTSPPGATEPQPIAATAHSESTPEAAHMIERRLRREQAVIGNPFGITPHRPNYILPLSYNDAPHGSVFSAQNDELELDNWEIKFQISFKVPVGEDLFDGRGQVYFAYSQVSFWQAFNDDHSSPFRETNYEPEVFIATLNDWRILGWVNRVNTLGFVHQSNGRSEPLSRSWNRIYANLLFERGNLVLSLKPWWRIPESESEDDNPDIEDYLGHYEAQLVYSRDSRSRSALLRYNASTGRGALQLDWTFPIRKRLKGYLQYFNGYGESLIDYNAQSRRIGLGVVLTDWL